MKNILIFLVFCLLLFVFPACKGTETEKPAPAEQETQIQADVLSVTTGGEAGTYTFTVQTQQP